MKSLSKFPLKTKTFDVDTYGIDVRQQVAAKSPYSGDVGIEIEVEGRNLPAGYTGGGVGGVTWTYHADGSLRAPGGGGPGGAEYVLSQPCKASDAPELVGKLYSYLKACKATLVTSTRCSVHVHLNMAGVKVPQLAAFVSLWGVFEDALANLCGGHRSGNHFAMRFSDSHAALDAWIDAFRLGSFAFSRERRYLALNPACLSTFGSLEVRTGGGTDNPADVVEWVETLLALKTYALSVTNPADIAADFSAYGPDGFAARVFGERVTSDLRAACDDLGESFETLVVAGFRRVQPLLYVLPWADVSVAASRVYVPNPFASAPKPRIRRAPVLDRFVPEPAEPELDDEDDD